ncbi:unnamed protein product [Chrysoparadoxa australica]
MATRISAAEHIHLWKYVKKVHVTFNPFGGVLNRAAREFLCRVQSPKLIKVNPKCEVKPIIVNKPMWPVIHVAYDDGTESTITATGMTCHELIHDMQLHLQKMELEYERQGIDINDRL